MEGRRMNFYYVEYYWEVVKHKRTGKILREGWRRNCEYETEEEAREGLEESRQAHPNYKYKLVKEAWEVLVDDLEDAV